MGAFTEFSEEALARYLIMFGVGELVDYKPISSGIENSNYFVTTSQHDEPQEFVLTIIEDFSFDEVPFFHNFMTHLSHFGLPVPAPKTTLDGMAMTIFAGKPTLLVPKIAGAHPLAPSVAHCRAIGKTLAELHNVAAARDFSRANPYHGDWAEEALASVASGLDSADLEQLSGLVAQYQALDELALPQGIIHGDLFRDNALFIDDELTGLIDFYHACTDFLALDLAIALNDWCRQDGVRNLAMEDAMVEGYESVRALEPEERALLPQLRLAACARFTLTRLLSGGDEGPRKNPAEFLRLARELGGCPD